MDERRSEIFKSEEPTPAAPDRNQEYYATLAVDIYETDDAVILTADMPGAARDTVDIDVNDGALIVTGRIVPDEFGGRVRLREYGRTGYYRSFQLSQTVDPANITANLKDGELTVKIPKTAKVGPRKIPVTSE